MENKNENLTPVQALSLSQSILGTIPYTYATEETIGKPLRDVILLLEKVKNAISTAIETAGEVK